MKIKLVNHYLFSVPVPFRVSWGKLGYSRHIIIILVDAAGKKGIGEGVLYKTTFMETVPYLKQITRFLKTANFTDYKQIQTQIINKFISFEPAVVFALDTAIRDLQGEITKTRPDGISVTEEIFLTEKDLVGKINKFISRKNKSVKLKVGKNLNKDMQNIQKINEISKGKLKIKIDANRGYSFDQALEAARWGSDNNVVLFEEPINGSFSIVAKLRGQSEIPIMLDESVRTVDDLKQAIKTNCFDVFNLKLTRLGGISASSEYIKICEHSGKKISLGCSEELDVGMSAIFTLASKITNLSGLEGFGTERLGFSVGNPDFDKDKLKKASIKKKFPVLEKDQNPAGFLINEFAGIWKTRAENAILRYSL